MSSHSQALETLRELGYRLTPQRMLILAAVAEADGHMGVDEVHRRAKEAYPYMDIATIYRTLHLLKKVGVVTEVAIGDRMHYELTDPHGKHHHMVCRLCHGAFNLSPHYLGGIPFHAGVGVWLRTRPRALCHQRSLRLLSRKGRSGRQGLNSLGSTSTNPW